MSSMNFNTSNQTFRQAMGNGLSYQVPRFQRDYSWTQDEWDDLWQDIQEVRLGNEPAHYMGYLVLQTRDQKTFDVIDGQQRLTTLSLLVLALLRALQELVEEEVDPENNKQRVEQLRSTYIGYLDPVTLIPRSKLSLNRNNDGYYRDYIVPLQKLPQRGLRASEHQLRKAFEWFYKQITASMGSAKDGTVFARFIDDLADQLFFTIITVTDELNAFKVFETLNARGVRLSPTDLLKNYLFSVVYREQSNDLEIAALERRWEAMVSRLGGESFPDFLRTHWNSRNRFVRESELFKTIRTDTPDKAKVFDLIRNMEQDIGAYAALSNPDDELWNQEQRRHIRELKMFSVRQPWPLLVSAHRQFDLESFTAILRACSIASFRYNVIGGQATNEQERTYNSVAQKISSGIFRGGSDVILSLAPVYVADSQFAADFSTKSLRTTSARNKQVVRYILFALEKQMNGHDLDIDSSRYNLEHILPENPGDSWPNFVDEKFEQHVYRLGNMTPLEVGLNRDAGNKPFTEKMAYYSQSAFELTRKVAEENSEWTTGRIMDRQQQMSRLATAIWRVSQLS